MPPQISLNTKVPCHTDRVISPTTGKLAPMPLNLGPISTHHHPSRSATRLELMPHAPSSNFASYPSEKSPSTPQLEEEKLLKHGLSDDEESSRAMVAFSVSFYLVAALVMVFVNKWVLNSVTAPLFFLFCQLVIAVLLFQCSAALGYCTLPTFNSTIAKGLAPLISINVIGLIFNTYCLQFVDASFYQVARGLILPFTVLFSYILLKTTVGFGPLLAVVVVCVGFGFGVSAEALTTSTIGICFGVFSSITTSVHAIVVKRSLPVVKNSALDMAYYNNLLSALLVAPTIVLAGEIPMVLDILGFSDLENSELTWEDRKTFMIGGAITGLFGFLICIAGFLSIKVTSPTTHMISSAVRGVLQTFLAKSIFGDVITSGRATGIAFILTGSAIYTWAKDREMRAKKHPTLSMSQTRSSSSSALLPTNNATTTSILQAEPPIVGHGRNLSLMKDSSQVASLHGRKASFQKVVVHGGERGKGQDRIY